MKTRKFAQRANFLAFVFFACLIVILFRLISTQIVNGQFYQQLVHSRLELNNLLPPRGVIIDRNQKVLAKDIGVASLYAYPYLIDHPETVAEKLSPFLELSTEEILQLLAGDERLVCLDKQIPLHIAQKIERERLEGIDCIPSYVRFYPQAPLFSNLIGFVGTDRQGLEGIEYTFDHYLAGKVGYSFFEKDALGREIPLTVQRIDPSPGNNLVLTVDSSIQFFVEEALDRAMERTKAKSATVIVSNPQTGDILAMASRPSFDNQVFNAFPPERWKNLGISMVFEPGSTIKPLVMAAALEEGVVSLGDRFRCNGSIRVHNHRVRCIHSHGEQTLEEVLINSCNVGVITIAQKLGAEKLFYYLKQFGLGEKTGINLVGEESGILRNPRDWSLLSMGAVPIGQEVAVTPLQLLQALSALANEGILMKPRLVMRVEDAAGRVIEEFSPIVEKQVVHGETARLVLEMMEKTVREGTGKKAYVSGFKIAGKTGTGQKAGEDGTYAPGRFFSSFVGFFPLPQPRFGIVVVLDEPEGEYYGGDVAAPVFQEIASQILRYTDIIPEDAEVRVF